MGDPHGITDQSPVDLDKAAKWTVFLLVDLKVVFIITYVYVSVVNLISTTANGEASEDAHSTKLFTVTSLPGHTDVNVSFIDDAILWSCRDHSVTKHYYRGLYWMLISAFSGTIVAFIFTKITVICGAKHGCPYLWRLAIIECLQQMQSDKKIINDKIIKEVKKKLNEKGPLRKVRCWNVLRIVSLCLSVAFLVAGMVLTFCFMICTHYPAFMEKEKNISNMMKQMKVLKSAFQMAFCQPKRWLVLSYLY